MMTNRAINHGCLHFVLIFLFSCTPKRSIDFPSYFPQSNRQYFDTVSSASIHLGKLLFFDKRLSSNNTISCVNCHLPELAFTDGKSISKGIHGRASLHNASTLLNIGFSPSFMFDLRATNIELQPMLPINDSNEMNSSIFEIEKKLSLDKQYDSLSKIAYGTSLNAYAFNRALAAYMKSLISCNSRFDDFLNTKDSSIFDPDERKGMTIFFGKGNCSSCHTAPLFSNYRHYNLGLEDTTSRRFGLYRTTHRPLDRGRFKTPVLRNIEITKPYFHDGRAESLEECLDIHLSRSTYDYTPPILSSNEKKQLVLFLKTLTDKKYKNVSSLPL